MDDSKKLCLVTFFPQGASVLVPAKTVIAEAAERASIFIPRSCGGNGTCGKCRVRVLDCAAAAPPSETEITNISQKEVSEGVRLACCATVEADCDIEILTKDCTGSKNARILHTIADSHITAWDSGESGCGIAVDIGTTTVVCCLLDRSRKRVLGTEAFLNPQIKYGDDVVSRISCSSDDEGLARLQSAIVRAIDNAASELTKRNNIHPDDIKTIAVAANTVMQHIFMGVSPSSIGRAPYEPQYYSHAPVSSTSLGFVNVAKATIYPLPNVAGYVGADITAGAAATGLCRDDSPRLLVDIGTNNEIAISTQRGVFCCAAAAGPALEGARIKYGMRAAKGALDHVWLEADGLATSTIGGGLAVGICGSGLIDTVATLLDAGVIKDSGRIIAKEDCRDERLAWRIVHDECGKTAVLLAGANDKLCLTQKDVREFQLAVAAIRAGVEVMLELGETSAGELKEVILSGAFGNYIDVKNAIRTGLLPDVDSAKVHGAGNSSGLGACMAVASRDFMEKCDEYAKSMRYVELSMLEDFQERFVRLMKFK